MAHKTWLSVFKCANKTDLLSFVKTQAVCKNQQYAISHVMADGAADLTSAMPELPLTKFEVSETPFNCNKT
ncbi:unnamed protein product [Didymodactylos carnosus]|uniref:Uncharacterized protein n=1 Tax=Didymodactylos carnosus TaxID=1234261 RepID=A0A8S2SCB6_9BILA|nr:unnamed protein product [Didymodactylos carnosus]CAF4220884.1 unnamed protein product [Didymodactylos carnosus]